MSGGSTAALGLLLAVAATAAAAQQPATPPPIADNSFLIEEAYNQEPGVVQHISVFQLFRGADTWAYGFTQEWPLWGQTHQLSVTVPLLRTEHTGSGATGLGDAALTYRFQLAAGGRLALAPRVSLLLPTGQAESGLGAGALGVQVSLPASVTLARHIVTHWNAAVTLTPSAKNAASDAATTTGYALAASAVWLARPSFNVLLEVLWTRDQQVTGPGSTEASGSLVLSPGIRWAHNLASGLQIVPGIAFPIGAGPSAGADALLLYLSFEHPFRSGKT